MHVPLRFLVMFQKLLLLATATSHFCVFIAYVVCYGNEIRGIVKAYRGDFEARYKRKRALK